MATATFANSTLAGSLAEVAAKAPSRLFLVFVGFTMAVSSIVLIEPAPVDAMVLGALLLGILSGILGFSAIRPVPAVLLAIFVIANLISLYNPIDGMRATWYVLVTLYLCLSWVFFVSFIRTYGKRGMRTIIIWYTVAALVCAILGLLSYFHIIGFQNYLLLNGRPKGTFKDPNVYGPYLIPVALLALTGLVSRLRGMKGILLNAAIFFVLTAGLILSFSRACWINFAISLFSYLAFAYLLRRANTPPPFSISRVIVLMVLGGIALGIILELPAVKSMMEVRVTHSGLQGYDRDRFRTQRMALQSAEEHPLGIGPGQAELAFDYATHSSYMRVLSENGWIGEFAYVSFVLVCLGRGIWMGVRTTDEFWRKIFFISSACILGHMVNSGVVDTIHWRHYWFLLALPWCIPESPVPERSISEEPANLRQGFESGFNRNKVSFAK
jgi:O-antigen ligase